MVRTGDRSYRKGQFEILASPELTRQYALSEGAAVTGQVERKNGEARLVSIETLGGMEPKAFGKRPRFSDMVVIDPHQRFELGLCGNKCRLFGLARTIENAGSVTIIATCLINTGSQMDQLIFEEFKGTGNSEVVLDISLAEARIFPAFDIPASGTRKEAKLYNPEHNQGLATLRRVLSNYGTRDAMQSLFKLLNTYSDNRAFLESMCSGQG